MIFLLCALVVGSMNGWAVEVLAYTLSATAGSDSGYGTSEDITISSITWNVTANSTMVPWRLGHSKTNTLSDENRVIYSKTAISDNVTKIEITHGSKAYITVNSMTVTVHSSADDAASGSNAVASFTPSYVDNGTVTVTKADETSWAGKYYRIVYNLTKTNTSNAGYVAFSNAKFYKESSEVAITDISLPSTADVTVGKTRTLTATVTPDNHTGTVDWESDDESIATVSSEGVVTGVAAGSTTIRAKSHANSSINAECTVTVNEDVATLPFIWAGGSRSNLTALDGVTGNSLGDYADNAANRPYLVQLNAVGDYIQIRTNTQPGIVNVGVKMLGGNGTSKIIIQESSDGSEFTNVQELTISGSQNDVVNLVTTNAFKSTSRYVRIYKSVHNTGGNIGVGPINIALPGDPSIPVVSGTTVTLTTTANMDGWRAFYDATQDYTLDANTKAYVAAKSGTAGEVELTKLDVTAIPHGEAVILKTSALDHKMVLTKTTGAASLGANVLAYAASAAVDGYRLGFKDGTGVAFYKYTATAPASGVVYIDKDDVNTGSGARDFLTFGFGDDIETTGVNEVKIQKIDGQYFNLAGQRVAQPTKGLYIVNGKKVIIK